MLAIYSVLRSLMSTGGLKCEHLTYNTVAYSTSPQGLKRQTNSEYPNSLTYGRSNKSKFSTSSHLSKIPVTKVGFELQSSYIQCRYLKKYGG